MGTAELLASGKHADCVIKCQGLTLKLHKALLITKSTYFETLFDGSFAEANSSTVTMDEDPSLVARAIQFIYMDDYSETSLTNTSIIGHGQFINFTDTFADRHPIYLHIAIFYFAEIHSLDALKTTATKHFATHYFTSLHIPQVQPIVTLRNLDVDVIKKVFSHLTTDTTLRDLVVLGQKCNLDLHQTSSSPLLNDLITTTPDFALAMIRRAAVYPNARCLTCGSFQATLWNVCACGQYNDCMQPACAKALIEPMRCLRCWTVNFSTTQRAYPKLASQIASRRYILQPNLHSSNNPYSYNGPTLPQPPQPVLPYVWTHGTQAGAAGGAGGVGGGGGAGGNIATGALSATLAQQQAHFTQQLHYVNGLPQPGSLVAQVVGAAGVSAWKSPKVGRPVTPKGQEIKF